MSNLIINRFKYRIVEDSITIYLRSDDGLFFQREAKYVIDKFKEAGYNDTIKKFEECLPDDYVQEKFKLSFDFQAEEDDDDTHAIAIDLQKIPYFKKSFIKRSLINLFRLETFIVEPLSSGADLSVFERNSEYNANWDVYTVYDIVIHSWENEISIGLGSTDTLISKAEHPIDDKNERMKAIDSADGFIKPLKFIEQKTNLKIVANKEKRIEIGVRNKIKKSFYKEIHQTINYFYNFLLNKAVAPVRIESGGFKTVHPADIGQVDFEKNLMLFGRGHTDINAASGMRDGGPIELPKEKAERLKFLFIYQNTDQANNLYFSLKRGLKHYPGLLSYVGIPVNITNERLQYTKKATLLDEFDGFVAKSLPEGIYPDYFALVLLPFSRETASPDDIKLYFHIKEKLLQKNIPSQDIYNGNVNSGSFHYHLPNISIAILAKIGGIPWKLKRKPYQELLIGFNEKKLGNDSILGSAIYFDNSGKLRQVKAFPAFRSRFDLICSLRDSIQQYLEHNQNNPPERLIIHYYKPPRQKEMRDIHKLIRDEFRFNMPFALVEINDSKVKTDLCFDVGDSYGMPTSGTFVRLKKDGNEYLLFNNLRYWQKPIKPINLDEYPIKIKLYNTESGGFTHNELLSQVYEFSRLYWKGLKQRSQPVTTEYAKMIAEFAIHFEDQSIPENLVSQNTAWFI